MLEICSVFFCLWLATKVRGFLKSHRGKSKATGQAMRSVFWGAMAVTLPLLMYFGVLRYSRGQGVPAPFWVIVCLSLTSVVMMGAGEVTGNVIIDTLIISASLTACSFLCVNGVPEAFSRLGWGNFLLWVVVCLCASVFVRALLWAREGGSNER
jgi:FtsH-binding integral membrane protein